jgi:peptidoglycan/xylan/chitin deacetylase (PgdA/CDA1 family)
MRAISLLFHDVYRSDPAESGFVSAAADRYKLSLADFDAQLANIARLRADAPLASAGQVLPVPPGVGDVTGRTVTNQALPYTITFDDGGVSYHTLIADRLEARGWRGYCFVSTDFIGRRGFLDAQQIRELDARGHVIGSHSASHPARFSALPFAAMVREWRDSRAQLEDILGRPVRVGSVPGGYFSAAVARAAADAGLATLFTSEPITTVDPGRTPSCLGRFTIRQGDAADAAMRFLAAAPWARSAAWLSWNAKAVAKPLLGPAYSHVADWVCGLRRTVPRLAAGAARRD